MELQNFININHLWYFRQHFPNIRCRECVSEANNTVITCLAILSKKSENDIADIVKKTHNFIRKTKSYLKKNPNDLEKLHPDFPEEGKEERPAGHVGVFCQNLGITHSIYFKKLLILKVTFHLTIRVFLKYMIILELGEMPVLIISICLN